jgi:hypothetical protein
MPQIQDRTKGVFQTDPARQGHVFPPGQSVGRPAFLVDFRARLSPESAVAKADRNSCTGGYPGTFSAVGAPPGRPRIPRTQLFQRCGHQQVPRARQDGQ